MKPKDIKVGAIYRNTGYNGTRYLGVGKHQVNGKYTNKYLVCLNGQGCEGGIVWYNSKDNSLNAFWNNFRLVSECHSFSF